MWAGGRRWYTSYMSPDSFADAVTAIVRARGYEPDVDAVRVWIRESVARAVAAGRTERRALTAMSPEVCAAHWIGEMCGLAEVEQPALPPGQVPLSL